MTILVRIRQYKKVSNQPNLSGKHAGTADLLEMDVDINDCIKNKKLSVANVEYQAQTARTMISKVADIDMR